MSNRLHRWFARRKADCHVETCMGRPRSPSHSHNGSIGRPSAVCISFARRLDPGLEDRDFSDAGRRLDRMDDGAFVRFGLSPRDIAKLRARFAPWPRV